MRSLENDIIFDPELNAAALAQIDSCKKHFLAGLEDPLGNKYILPEVAQSWVRSKKFTVNPYTEPREVKYCNLRELVEKNTTLLNAAVPILEKKLLPLLSGSKYVLSLTDKTGAFIYLDCGQNDISYTRPIYAREETIGTNAISLCIQHTKPVQLVGPNNFLFSFETHISSAAPILNADEQIVGTLAIIELQGEAQMQHLRTHSYLGWVISTAEAITRQLELNAKDEQLQATYHLLQTNRISRNESEVQATYSFSDICGTSDKVRNAVHLAQSFATTSANVLLIGESGTGKELFAQAIHNLHRPAGPFIAINCASLPRTLIESELFGYEGGAFTGAEKSGRRGKFELADSGTLFLDEIGDMPMEVQPVLLRALETKKIMRIGGAKYIPVDVRIIAATNKDLLQAVSAGQFRNDLYYRLAVLRIDIPPLRSRQADILSLAEHFIAKICSPGKRVPVLSDEARRILQSCPWPGNVRQLENAMVYAVNLCKGDVIEAYDLSQEIYRKGLVHSTNHLSTLAELEKNAIEEALSFTEKNTDKAAKILGVARSTLYRKIKEYDIEI